MSEAINYITEDKHAVIETDMSEFKDCKVEDEIQNILDKVDTTEEAIEEKLEKIEREE